MADHPQQPWEGAPSHGDPLLTAFIAHHDNETAFAFRPDGRGPWLPADPIDLPSQARVAWTVASSLYRGIQPGATEAETTFDLGPYSVSVRVTKADRDDGATGFTCEATWKIDRPTTTSEGA